MIVPHLFSFILILCVGDEPFCTIVWWLPCCVRRIVDMKLVSQAFVATDMPRRWCVCWICLQHKYWWKCWRNTPDTQYKATGLTHEFKKLRVTQGTHQAIHPFTWHTEQVIRSSLFIIFVAINTPSVVFVDVACVSMVSPKQYDKRGCASKKKD